MKYISSGSHLLLNKWRDGEPHIEELESPSGLFTQYYAFCFSSIHVMYTDCKRKAQKDTIQSKACSCNWIIFQLKVIIISESNSLHQKHWYHISDHSHQIIFNFATDIIANFTANQLYFHQSYFIPNNNSHTKKREN